MGKMGAKAMGKVVLEREAKDVLLAEGRATNEIARTVEDKCER